MIYYIFTGILMITIFNSCYYKPKQKKNQEKLYLDIQDLQTHQDDNILIEKLMNVYDIQFSENGEINILGYETNDKRLLKSFKLLQYDNSFNLTNQAFITNQTRGVYELDKDLNFLFCTFVDNKPSIFKYPNYNKTDVPHHPLTAKFNEILEEQVVSGQYNSKLYQELVKQNKRSEITRRNDLVSSKAQELLKQFLKDDEIKKIEWVSGGYFIFENSGNIYYLRRLRTTNNKASVYQYIKENISTSNKQQNDPNKNKVTLTGFYKTKSKSTLKNWPNQGYTKGFYCYAVNIGDHETTFKVEDFKNKTPIKEINNVNSEISFIQHGKTWYMIKQK